ncbi:MAG: ABC transporter permease [Alphaproteobacteria bacterium]|nr:ABC transporter permease [Alphaproteobacteria bacterium]
MSPLMQKRWQLFRQNTLALWAGYIFIGILIIALLTPLLANDKPLLVSYKNNWYMPFLQTELTDMDFGGNLPTFADYQDTFTQNEIKAHGWMIWAPVPYSYDTVDYFSVEPFPAAPSARHWLGTDDQGRDLLARLLYGLRLSLAFGILLTLFSSVMGITVGAIQGYFGGKADIILGRFLEMWSSLPQLFILIILASFIKPTFLSLLIILLLFSWSSLSGVVRAEFLRGRSLDYVRAAKLLGAGHVRIMFHHILPNALIATFTYLPFILSGSIVALSALDFLGLGLPNGSPSLGEIIRQGKENIFAPWIGISIFVTLGILLSLLLFIGDGVRAAFDPNTKERQS